MNYTDFNGNEYDTLEEAIKANEEISKATETEETQPLPEKLTKKQLLDKIDILEEERNNLYTEYREFVKSEKEKTNKSLEEIYNQYEEERKILNNQIEELKKETTKRAEKITEQHEIALKAARKQYNEANESYWEAVHEYQKEYGNGVYAKFYDGKKASKDFINTSVFADEIANEISRDINAIRKLFWF